MTVTCPQCGRAEPDLGDGVIVAHSIPEYRDGCGYCSHPERDGTREGGWRCTICGDVMYWGWSPVSNSWIAISREEFLKAAGR